MRSLASGTFLSIAMALGGHAQSATQAQDIQRLTTLRQQFEALAVQGDVEKLGAWLDQYMADDFTCILIDGGVLTKAQEKSLLIDLAKSGITMNTTEQKITVISDTAVSTSQTHVAQKSGPSNDVTFRHMDVWIRTNGDWKWLGAAGAQVR
jgi:Domain of unknown function (DUF4440)